MEPNGTESEIQALVRQAVESASVLKAEQAVAEEAPKIVEKALAEATKRTTQIVTEVAEGLEKRMEAQYEKMVEKAIEKSAARSTFGRLPKAGNTNPVADDPGLMAARLLRAWLVSNRNTAGIVETIRDVFKDKAGAEYAARALETTKPSTGGALIVPQTLVEEFIPLLRQESVLLGDVRRIPMPSGAINIPGFNRGVNMGWTGELSPNRSQTPGFKAISMSSKKAYCIVAISKDLLEEASVDADRLVRADIVAALAELLDEALLLGERTNYTPQGLLTHPDITKTAHAALVNADLPATILARVMARKVKFTAADAGWRFNHSIWLQFYNLKNDLGVYEFREEMDRGMLAGYPYKVTTLIPNASGGHETTNIFFGKWSELFLGETRDLRFELSDQAAYYDENGVLKSAYSEDSTLIKATYKCDADVRMPEAFDITTGVYTVA